MENKRVKYKLQNIIRSGILDLKINFYPSILSQKKDRLNKQAAL